MKITVHIPQSEINGLIISAAKWEAEVKAQIIVLIEETTRKIWEEARQNVPIRSGGLRDSIKKSDIEQSIRDMAGEVRVEKFYGRFVELGTPHALAQPFLRPAYEKHIPAFTRKLRKIISTT